MTLPMPLRAVHCLLLHGILSALQCTEERSIWTTEFGHQLRSLAVPCEIWKQLCLSEVSVAPTLALQLTLLTSLHIHGDSGGDSSGHYDTSSRCGLVSIAEWLLQWRCVSLQIQKDCDWQYRERNYVMILLF